MKEMAGFWFVLLLLLSPVPVQMASNESECPVSLQVANCKQLTCSMNCSFNWGSRNLIRVDCVDQMASNDDPDCYFDVTVTNCKQITCSIKCYIQIGSGFLKKVECRGQNICRCHFEC
ncbi:hypothetical protein IEQ34_016693 [Dendrobium chrysotoxum]|uniref:Uncharacterized protein n=1 Tax=Dendrobium chrysotoxum TaxID=161865 RepID=A0AAV7FYS7_DENCH|nr:hypothetical protein IEQ34_016693 [Dendrobium chrysotoxum]